MQALGARFGASYFSLDPSKGWAQRRGLVAEYHRAGLATVGVWETTAGRAGQGCAAGRADAREAARQAAAVGNKTRPIDFAIDFDATGAQVAAYFRCAHSVLGSRTNAYGGYSPLQYLCVHRLVGHQNWQTYAWSNGRWLPASCAPLEQWLNGSSVDYDRAIAKDYGQWPYVPVTPQQHRAALVRALHAREADRRKLHRLVDAHHCRPGQHNTPRQPTRSRRAYHRLCGEWLTRGKRDIELAARYRHELKLG